MRRWGVMEKLSGKSIEVLVGEVSGRSQLCRDCGVGEGGQGW